MLEYLEILLLLLFIATVSSLILKKLNFPYTIGLVVIGIIVSRIFETVNIDTSEIKLTPDLILLVLLPALIFEAAMQINPRELVKNLFPTLTLAGPGLVISTFLTGGIVYYCTSLELGYAMLFGALISATDPVAVIALFRDIGAPKRLTMLVDSESICNDATAIVMFTVIKKIVITGATITLMTGLESSVSFLSVFFSGIIVGAVVGGILVFCISKAKQQPMVQIALMTIAAYAAYIVADKGFESSGVMSVLGAGIVISYYVSSHFSTELKNYVDAFWEFAAFIANSFIFLLLGFSEAGLLWDFSENNSLFSNVAGAILAVLVSRAVVVFGLSPIIGAIRKSDKISWKYQIIMFWGGLRGAVPIALVLSLDTDFKNREILVGLTLGIVLFTLLVQGTTVKWLMKRLGLDKPEAFYNAQKRLAKLHVRRSGLLEVKKIEKMGVFPKKNIDDLQKKYKKSIQELIKGSDDMGAESFWVEALMVSKRTYASLFDAALLSSTTYGQLQNMCDRHVEEVLENGRLIFENDGGVMCPASMTPDRIIQKIKNMLARKVGMTETSNELYKIEVDIALYISSTEVLEMLESCWQEFTHKDPKGYGECVDYFAEVYKNAKAAYKELADSGDRKISLDIEGLLQRVVRVGEFSELDKLEEKGVITGEIHDAIKEKL